MIEAIDDNGLIPEQVLPQSEEGMIDSEKHAELRAMQNKLFSLEPYEQEIGNSLFKYRDDAKNTLIIPNEIKKELEALGFDAEWIAENRTDGISNITNTKNTTPGYASSTKTKEKASVKPSR